MTNDIVRRDPFAALEGFTPFRRVFDRVFDDPFFRSAASAFNDEGALALDVYEKDGQLKVEASLPGYRKEDVDVQLHDGILSIKAQRSEEHEEGEKGSKFYRRERSWGSVSRRVALPGIVKDADVAAELKNGVLTLTIPLPEEKQPKQIEIRGE
ncbi:MAG: Hsp20/alpha crystallin family protein [Dehalococcoidia bacterium]